MKKQIRKINASTAVDDGETRVTVKITKSIEKRINAACRRECGGKRIVYIGEFTANERDSSGMNFLLADEDYDLVDTWDVAVVSCEIPAYEGFVALDCYCYFPPGHDEEGDLDTNVYLLIDRAGKVVYESSVGNPRYMEEIDAIVAAAY